MISGKLDSLNLKTSKPSLNAKTEAAPIAKGFDKVLAKNISLSAENLPNVNSPNTVSEDDLKTFTENLNNFSNLNLAEQNLAGELSQPGSEELTEEALINPLLMNMVAQQPQAQVKVPEQTAESFMAAAKAAPAQKFQISSTGVVDSTQLLDLKKETANLENKSALSEKAEIQKAAAEILPASVESKGQEVPLSVNGKEFSLAGFELVKPQKFEITAPTVETAEAPKMEAAGLDGFPITGIDKDSAKSQGEFRDQDFSQNQDNSALVTGDHNQQNTLKEKVSSTFNQTLEAQKGADGLPKATTEQIVTHARTVINQGGGEMNLKLNPEGMGPVDLKVGVKNGLVNIEINTQNAKTKKIFESGIADIRGALESQNLRMENLKVNMTERPDNQMSNNGQQMSDKDFARQFMGQFRDERHGFRNQTMNNAFEKFRGSSKQNDPVGLRPSSTMRTQGASRLNVVG